MVLRDFRMDLLGNLTSFHEHYFALFPHQVINDGFEFRSPKKGGIKDYRCLFLQIPFWLTILVHQLSRVMRTPKPFLSNTKK